MATAVSYYPDKTIIFLSGAEGRKRFDAIECRAFPGEWKPIIKPSAFDIRDGLTEYRYIKKVISLGGLVMSFEVREAK